MINYVDYIFDLNLNNLDEKVDGKWNATCPLCDDAEKSELSKRLWFLPKDDSYVVFCFNSGCEADKGISFYNFLEIRDKELFENFKTETRKDSFNDIVYNKQKRRKSYKKEITFDILNDNTKFHPGLSKKSYESIICNKEAIEYCKNRKIPEEIYKKFYWCYNKKSKFYNKLVMPLYRNNDNKIYGFVARSLTNKRFLVSFTSELNVRLYNIYNIDNERPVYILESMIDAYNVDNSIAMLTATIPDHILCEIKKPIFCFDNDSTGLSKSLEYSKKGYKVILFPDSFKYKDINEAMCDGDLDKEDINRLLISNTYQGLNAVIRINKIIRKTRRRK